LKSARFVPETRVLTHGGAPVALGARGDAVLHALFASSNEFVATGSIIDAAWPGVVVEEGDLAVPISAIRRVLARVPEGEQCIETSPRPMARNTRCNSAASARLGDREHFKPAAGRLFYP
jgi:DNA-binding winged helix-turn-helix (wHTH) protein